MSIMYFPDNCASTCRHLISSFRMYMHVLLCCAGPHALPLAAQVAPIRQTRHGRILSFIVAKGIGFISHPEFPNNVFFSYKYVLCCSNVKKVQYLESSFLLMMQVCTRPDAGSTGGWSGNFIQMRP